jgi:Zn ribbon nucleic-acid-binding protein
MIDEQKIIEVVNDALVEQFGSYSWHDMIDDIPALSKKEKEWAKKNLDYRIYKHGMDYEESSFSVSINTKKIIEEVNDALVEQFESYTLYDLIDDTNLSDEEKEWAKKNLDYRVYTTSEKFSAPLVCPKCGSNDVENTQKVDDNNEDIIRCKKCKYTDSEPEFNNLEIRR